MGHVRSDQTSHRDQTLTQGLIDLKEIWIKPRVFRSIKVNLGTSSLLVVLREGGK